MESADVGCKPTIEGVNPVAVETNIFDFNENSLWKESACLLPEQRAQRDEV